MRERLECRLGSRRLPVHRLGDRMISASALGAQTAWKQVQTRALLTVRDLSVDRPEGTVICGAMKSLQW